MTEALHATRGRRVRAPTSPIATPAFPDNQRTVFKGYLFVGDVLLHESGMQNHPLTPMTDSNLVRVLQAQCRAKVGLIDYSVVAQGDEAIRARIDGLRAEGVRIAIVDAISNDDLLQARRRARGMPLVTAGSGVAIGLAANFGIAPSERGERAAGGRGLRAIVSGSCSLATNRQVRAFIDGGRGGVSRRRVANRRGRGRRGAGAGVGGAALCSGPVLVYSTAEPDAVKAVQQTAWRAAGGRDSSSRTLADVARGLVERGVRQLVVAGGETAGACVQALDVTQLRIGPQIDPGVPWCHAESRDAPGVRSAPGAEVRQLRRRRFLHQGLRVLA